ncbi:OsmC family protein [Amycolatopsis acidicola]|uniref:OsmC family protein n=1 Tax=Amycolatopsis acidicola TaxID=2596893 RepID=A0A5N0UVU1_9PSEU|nr:OsmC family protein [Amycolatopsis acidicola]KAA9154207.1 OsmC family protein [Amycolatopsis acidicola]
MDTNQLRELQAPLKDKYREAPESAVVTMRSEAELDALGVSCRVQTGQALVEAGLHPAAGGDGSLACSGDMLLDALAACAGVTLRAVATSLGLEIRGGKITAEGDLDFRGTLGVDKAAPVGFREIRLGFDLDTDADAEQLATLEKLTERYCVVYQTLRNAIDVSTSFAKA